MDKLPGETGWGSACTAPRVVGVRAAEALSMHPASAGGERCRRAALTRLGPGLYYSAPGRATRRRTGGGAMRPMRLGWRGSAVGATLALALLVAVEAGLCPFGRVPVAESAPTAQAATLQIGALARVGNANGDAVNVRERPGITANPLGSLP